MLSRLIYPPRATRVRKTPSAEEIDAWVEASGTFEFQETDDLFVERARALGITSGMVLDLNSPLGLVAMKILWHEEGLLAIGVYRSLEVAERARQTAEEWELGQRMFFQVGEPAELKFKAGYFDMVVSDGALHTTERPAELLKEIHRVTKPGGGILLSQMARPNRLRIRGVLSARNRVCPTALARWEEERVRAGYTRPELASLVREAGLDRTHVVASGSRLFIERPGANDPSSWVSERERYR
jgi:SAM-dependent methyltransferase